MTRTVGVREAKARLSELIDTVLRGEEVVISRHGTEVVRLVPVTRRRRPGSLRGRIHMAPDFDETPEELIDAFEGRGEPPA
jgi:prevent-host-death family protein